VFFKKNIDAMMTATARHFFESTAATISFCVVVFMISATAYNSKQKNGLYFSVLFLWV